MTSLVVDTHAILWLLEGNEKLPVVTRKRLEDPTVRLFLPALAVAELVDLISKGRSRLDMADLSTALHCDKRLGITAMDEPIALSTQAYTSLSDIHDRCIVATTASLLEMGHDAVLVARDQSIRESGFVPTLWE